jgi:DNA-binding beta-propeller fold protein YncE
MRYIDVGITSGSKYPAAIHVAPDGQYWYVTFLAGSFIEKYRTSDDAYMGSVNLGAGSYHSFTITPDSKKAFCFDFATPGKIVYIDLQGMNVLSTYLNGNNFLYPIGAAINSSATILYAGAQFGNYIYKIDISNPLSPVIVEKQIDGTTFSDANAGLDPFEIALSPDGSKYYITCQYSKELRVMKVANDSLIATIPLDYYPQQMSFSNSTNYLFVACPEDTLSFVGKRGSVTVIDYQSNTIVKKIYAGWESYGVGVDDSKKVVCVSNMNINTGGPGPHHTSNCGGRNGYATFIDLNTLTMLPQKIELGNVPYAISVRK